MASLQEKNKEIVRRYLKEFIEGQNDAVHWELISPEFLERVSGQKGAEPPFFFITKIVRPAFPDIKVVIHDMIAEGDKVVVYKSHEGTHKGEFMGIPPTGKRVSFAIIEILTLRDGKYVEHFAISDSEGLMQQLRSNGVE